MENATQEELRKAWEIIIEAMKTDPTIIVLDPKNGIEYCSGNQ